jgi:hypothetical protein
MLEPQTRAALTDMLHPPSGFSLSHAVATTFTLDLDTALTVPLSFAAHRVTADEDPIGILDAVRRAAAKVDIFAQAGQVSIEVPPSALVAFLEPMVHPVEVKRGIFQPKVWFLEYERAYALGIVATRLLRPGEVRTSAGRPRPLSADVGPTTARGHGRTPPQAGNRW